MMQGILVGLVAGALAVGLPGTAGAQAAGAGAAQPAPSSGAGKSTTSGKSASGGSGKAATSGAGTQGAAGDTGQQSTGKAGAKPAARSQSTGTASLGSVHIGRAVKANGERLAPGTYTVRLTPDEAKPEVKGQTPSLERWVEFLQGSQVKGREVVTIVPENEIAQVAKGKRVPNGSSRVEMLKGNDYVRVWINRGGNNYLIHLPPA